MSELDIETLNQHEAAGLDCHLQDWEQERQALLTELEQLRSQQTVAESLDKQRLERISHLEQALDQALTSLDEFRLRVRDQQALETQLAATEEFTHIQQQAITKLKLQLDQQQILESQIANAQEREQAFQELLLAAEALAQAQQGELEHLRVQIAHDRAEAQASQQRLKKQLVDLQSELNTQYQRVIELDAQALAARTLAVSLEVPLQEAHRQVEELQSALSDRQTALLTLEAQLEQTQIALREQQALGVSLHHTQRLATEQTTTIASLRQELTTAHIKIEELETQVAKQVMLQARLQHTCQELETERDRHQSRATQLEQQVTDMQEQILKQARQTSEYEAAIQQWKDRCSNSYHQVLQIKELLDPWVHRDTSQTGAADSSGTSSSLEAKAWNPDLVDELYALLLKLLITLQPSAATDVPDSAGKKSTTTSRLSKNLTVDLPAFLSRRRSYKTP